MGPRTSDTAHMRVRISTQLAFGFAVPILALALVVGAVYVGFNQMQRSKTAMLQKESYRATVHEIALQVLISRYATRSFILGKQKRSGSGSQAVAIAKALKSVTYLEEHTAWVPEAAADVARLGADVNFVSSRSLMLQRAATKDRAALLDTFIGRSGGKDADASAAILANSTSAVVLKKTMDRISQFADAAAERSSATFDSQVQADRLLMLVIGLIALIATVAITIIYGNRTSRRLNRVSLALDSMVRDDFARLSQALARLAEGDLRTTFRSTRQPLGNRGSDEIGDLVGSYDALAEGFGGIGDELTAGLAKLRELVGGVALASRNLAASSEQTSAAANQASVAVEQIARAVASVAGGAKEQAVQISQAGAAIEELARSAEMIADGATHQATAIQEATGGIQKLDDGIESLSANGNDLARSARDVSSAVEGGNGAVTQTQEAMRRLRDTSRGAAQAMVSLEGRSTQVGEIVRTIEEIADQTNLLALNAAIEAARAGDHGRGFAVVADEVRKLAERSSGATREIAAILSAIRSETTNAAEAMRTSDTSMENGLALADRAAAALEDVERAIATTTSVADGLAERALAMRDASLLVTENVSSASAGVEENAAAASQMKSTTRDVTATILPVAAAAEEQSAAAHQAALATGELASGVQEIDQTARALRDQAERLDALVARFIVDDQGRAAGALVRSGERAMALAS